MQNKPLFSAVVLCYRHFEYLYEAIDAVLMQDYPSIELIVSDDGSPSFPKEEIEQYIETHKSENLKRYLVRTNEQNVGTVRHLNLARRCVHGEYVVFLAGDDRIYDKHVLSLYANGFSCAPENCYIEMAQTGMYDEKLEKLQGLYMTEDVRHALEKTETDSSELMQLLLIKGACLPSTSTCFKYHFFELFGDFDENYKLVEDYPMHVRLAKEHWIIHCETFIAIKHRHGGISHGQKGALRASQVMYYNDTRKMVEELQLGNIAELPPALRHKVTAQKKAELLWIDMLLAQSEKGKAGMIKVVLRHPGHFAMLVFDKLGKYIAKWQKRVFVCCAAGFLLRPIMTEMVAKAFNVSIDSVHPLCVGIVQVVFVLWCGMFIVYALNRFLEWINHFPKELINNEQ